MTEHGAGRPATAGTDGADLSSPRRESFPVESHAGAVAPMVESHAGAVAPIMEWNGLDQSAGFIIQSSPGGFGLDWIRNSPTQQILDWTGSINLQCVIVYPILRDF